jgi:hypothetical protein
MVAIVPLRQDTASGYLSMIAPGTAFWASPRWWGARNEAGK